MKNAIASVLTAVVQLGYFAIVVQAFVVTPPLKSFAPCACSIIEPAQIKRLLLVNQLPSSEANIIGDTKSENASGSKICRARQSAGPSPVLNNLQVESRLEKLIFEHSAQVELCVKLDANGKVSAAHAESAVLGDGDEKLIAKYVAENWTFRAAANASGNELEGYHAFVLGVHKELLF
jgi:hypothetical protein